MKVPMLPKRFIRGVLFLTLDVLLLSISLVFAFLLHFEGYIPKVHVQSFPIYLAIVLCIKVAWNAHFRLYNLTWSLVGMPEVLRAIKAIALGSICTWIVLTGLAIKPSIVSKQALAILPSIPSIPNSVLVIDYLLSTGLILFLRLAKRIYMHEIRSALHEGLRVLIIGAGEAGEQLVREMRHSNRGYCPVGFIDDDPAKHGTYIQGVRVLGSREDLPRILERISIDQVVIAMPSVPAKEIRDIVHRLRNLGMTKIKILPSLVDFVSGRVTLSRVREVQLDDLLGREVVQIDVSEVSGYIRRNSIWVTGAGGSIGSELARQIAMYQPRELTLIDADETELFNLQHQLRALCPDVNMHFVVCDVCNEHKVHWLMQFHRPNAIFHAAAYKHVPMMEEHPEEAVRVNVFGTLTLAKAAVEFSVSKFILISTDKAVKPVSVMGATKRLAEMVIDKFNGEGETKFMSVRFGNVLGSRGSVVPLFLEQIRRGGPITVTHPEMERYFMTVQEAVMLVLQAGAMGSGGEIFVLDMGERVKVVDLAHELIRLCGFESDKQIPIVYTGIRKGEKLREELVHSGNTIRPTKHEKIFEVCEQANVSAMELQDKLTELQQLIERVDRDGLKRCLQSIVPDYHPS